MLKNKIITLDDDTEYFVGDEIHLNEKEHYLCTSKYDKLTDDCEDDFYFFKVEQNANGELTITPVKDNDMNEYLLTIEKNKSE